MYTWDLDAIGRHRWPELYEERDVNEVLTEGQRELQSSSPPREERVPSLQSVVRDVSGEGDAAASAATGSYSSEFRPPPSRSVSEALTQGAAMKAATEAARFKRTSTGEFKTVRIATPDGIEG
jgi:sugar/nucleoside kinase (ribokinase family)